jgi:hypothetical protein
VSLGEVMREEYWFAFFWLLVIGSWVFGVAFGRWVGVGGGFFLELSKAVRVPSDFGAWWEPLVYFIFTTVAVFALAQIFFGAGAALFLFARGFYDSTLIMSAESTVRGWTFPNLPVGGLTNVLLIVLILAVNLPLCLWAAHMGTQRSLYVWQRLTGKPVKPEAGVRPMRDFLLVLAASIVAGLVASFLFSFAQQV